MQPDRRWALAPRWVIPSQLSAVSHASSTHDLGLTFTEGKLLAMFAYLLHYTFPLLSHSNSYLPLPVACEQDIWYDQTIIIAFRSSLWWHSITHVAEQRCQADTWNGYGPPVAVVMLLSSATWSKLQLIQVLCRPWSVIVGGSATWRWLLLMIVQNRSPRYLPEHSSPRRPRSSRAGERERKIERSGPECRMSECGAWKNRDREVALAGVERRCERWAEISTAPAPSFLSMAFGD